MREVPGFRKSGHNIMCVVQCPKQLATACTAKTIVCISHIKSVIHTSKYVYTFSVELTLGCMVGLQHVGVCTGPMGGASQRLVFSSTRGRSQRRVEVITWILSNDVIIDNRARNYDVIYSIVSICKKSNSHSASKISSSQ